MNEEDIVLYARAFRGRTGLGALASAVKQARLLGDTGDCEGAETWNQVAKIIRSLEGTPRDEIDISNLC